MSQYSAASGLEGCWGRAYKPLLVSVFWQEGARAGRGSAGVELELSQHVGHLLSAADIQKLLNFF